MVQPEKDLTKLLKTLKPELDKADYVYCHLPDQFHAPDFPFFSCFFEKEGAGVVITKEIADAQGLKYNGIFRLITLQCYSDLNAVGLTAAVSTALTKENIPCNVIAAFHHDHILVSKGLESQAIEVLQTLSAS